MRVNCTKAAVRQRLRLLKRRCICHAGAYNNHKVLHFQFRQFCTANGASAFSDGLTAHTAAKRSFPDGLKAIKTKNDSGNCLLKQTSGCCTEDKKMEKYGKFGFSGDLASPPRHGSAETVSFAGKISAAMASAGGEIDPTSAISVFLRELGAIFSASSVFIFESNGNGTSDNTFLWSRSESGNVRMKDLPDSALTDMLEAFRDGDGFVISDMEAFRHDRPETCEALSLGGLSRVVICPLSLEGKRIGFVGICDAAEDLMEICMSVLPMVCGCLALMIRRRRDSAAAEHLEKHDPLTGLLNRQCFRNAVEPIVRDARSGTGRGEWSILSFSIPEYRTFVAAKGKYEGDELLKTTAMTLRNELGTDRLARFSDDHFYAVVRSSDTAALLGRIHRIMPVNPISPADLRAGVHAIDGSEHNAMHACDMADRSAGAGTEPETDGVTGLPDVPHFLMTLESFRSQQKRGVLAGRWDVISVSILNFSEYNGDNGFSAGDALLASLAGIIRQSIGSELAARLSADRFIALVEDSRAEKAVRQIADEMRAGGACRVYAGIYTLDGSETDNGIALDRAGLAADAARDDEGTPFRRFEPEMESGWMMGSYIVSHIDEAIEKGWIRLCFQPAIGVLSGKIAAAEVLTRWDDPVYGLLQPGQFVPALGRAMLLYKLDLYVLEQVCRTWYHAEKDGFESSPVSINLAESDLLFPDLHGRINSICGAYHVPHAFIRFEIPESAVRRSGELVGKHISEFHRDGFEVWLDNFGSGGSSLGILQELSFDLVKIDMLAMRRRNDRQSAVMRGIIDTCKRLGVLTLAENVETPEQLEFLRSSGCSFAQGFLFAKPDSIDRLMSDRKLRSRGSESQKESVFYRRLGHLNVLDPLDPASSAGTESPRPVAILTSAGGRKRLVYTSRQFRELFLTLTGNDPDCIRKRETLRNPAFADLIVRLAAEADSSGKTVSGNFSSSDFSGLVSAEPVCGYEGFSAYFIRVSEREASVSRTEAEYRLASAIGAVCDSMWELSPDSGRWSYIFGATSGVRRLESLPADEASAAYAAENLPEQERERFLSFVGTRDLADRLAGTPRGALNAFFHIRQNDGTYPLKRVTLSESTEGGVRHRLLSVSGNLAGWDEAFISKISGNGTVPPDIAAGTAGEEWIIEESLWKAMSAQQKIGFFWKDRNRRFLGANDAFLRYYGLTLHDIIGKNDEDMHWHPDPEPFKWDEESVLRDGAVITEAVGECLVDGEVRKIMASKVPVRRGGKIVGLVGYFIDITNAAALAMSFARHSSSDKLSGLLNENGLLRELDNAAQLFDTEGRDFGLIEFRISSLRSFRDSFGAKLYAELVRKISSGISRKIPEGSKAAFRSGDRFDIVTECGSYADLDEIRETVTGFLSGVHSVGDTPVTLSFDSGYALYSRYGELSRMQDAVSRTASGNTPGSNPDHDEHVRNWVTRPEPAPAVSSDFPRLTAEEAKIRMRELGTVFDMVRVLDVSSQAVYQVSDDGSVRKTSGMCFNLWNRGDRCENCVSAKAFAAKSREIKLEFAGSRIYIVISQYVEIDRKPYAMEAVYSLPDSSLKSEIDLYSLKNQVMEVQREAYIDEPTETRNRRYFYEQLALLQADGVVLLDIDRLKLLNDRFGDEAGNEVLRACARTVKSCFRENDVVCRYGGDVFAVVCHDIPQAEFIRCCRESVEETRKISIPQLEGTRATISVGAHYGRTKVESGLLLAEHMLNIAKEKGDTFRID